jgi:hypothetical protein
MTWNPRFKIGFPGYEVGIEAQVRALQVAEDNVEVQQRNLVGAMKWSFLRMGVPRIVMDLARMTDSTMAKLRGFRASLSVLSFIFNTALRVDYLYAVASSTTSVTLPFTSARTITIIGVWLTSDPGKAGTNYFTSGSFNESTMTITLGSALPAANSEVFVEFTFLGYTCRMTSLAPIPHSGASADLWQAQVELTGV